MRTPTAGLLLLTALAAACGPQGPKAAPPAPKAASAGPAPTVEVDVGRRLKMKLVLVPAGKFSMGSAEGPDDERPVHEVTFAQPFYMAATEVTQEQWEAVMGDPPHSRVKGDELPVENVTWGECLAFLAKLSRKAGGEEFTLPSEAQWEYACRAGTTTWWFDGDNEKGLGAYAVYGSNSGLNKSGEDRPVRTHPGGLLKPNAWGLFDLHGNVWEYCADAWHPRYTGAPADGSAWGVADAVPHVIRGGAFDDSWRTVSSSARRKLDPDERRPNVGFRPVRAVPAQ